jgi:hypothetical protein
MQQVGHANKCGQKHVNKSSMYGNKQYGNKQRLTAQIAFCDAGNGYHVNWGTNTVIIEPKLWMQLASTAYNQTSLLCFF